MSAHPAAVRHGIGLFLAALVALASFDAAAKYLLQFYPAPFLNAVRYLTVLLVAAGWLLRRGRRWRDCFPAPFRALLLARGVALGTIGTCFMTALLWMPLSEATAIFFASPLLMVALSARLLGERIGGAQWLAVALGFGGMLLIVRPGSNLPPLGTALMVVAAISHALFQLLTRRLVGQVSADIQYASTALVCLLMALLPLPFFLPDAWPGAGHALLIAAGSACNGLGQLLVIAALQRASVARLAPFNYFHLIVAVAFSTLCFGQTPDALALGGMALIIATGVFLALSKR